GNEKAVAWAAEAGGGASQGSFADAARHGEIVFNCTRGSASVDAIKAAGEAMSKPFNDVFESWSKKAKQARAFQRVRPSQLPEALGKALGSLKSGETVKVPVKTEYGWHVIHVGAISPFVPPTFEQLKDSIRETLLTQLGEQRLAKLRSEAKVVTETPAAGKPATPVETAPAEKPSN
nr:peptidylprolyl isomerase [Dokdonella sp.]